MEATTMFRFFSAVMVNPKPHKLFSSLSIFPSATAPRHFQSLKFPTKQNAHSENRDIGDRVVFDDGIFESDAVFQNDSNLTTNTPFLLQNLLHCGRNPVVHNNRNLAHPLASYLHHQPTPSNGVSHDADIALARVPYKTLCTDSK